MFLKALWARPCVASVCLPLAESVCISEQIRFTGAADPGTAGLLHRRVTIKRYSQMYTMVPGVMSQKWRVPSERLVVAVTAVTSTRAISRELTDNFSTSKCVSEILAVHPTGGYSPGPPTSSTVTLEWSTLHGWILALQVLLMSAPPGDGGGTAVHFTDL